MCLDSIIFGLMKIDMVQQTQRQCSSLPENPFQHFQFFLSYYMCYCYLLPEALRILTM